MKSFFLSLIYGMIIMFLFMIWIGDISFADFLFIITTPSVRG